MVGFMVKNVTETIVVMLCLLRVECDWRMKKVLKDGEAREDLAATYTHSDMVCHYHLGSQYPWF